MAKQVTVYESDGTTLAQETYDEGSVEDGAASTPRRLWWKNTSTSSETLADTRFRRVAVGANDGLDSLQIAEDDPLAAPGQPAGAAAAGSELEVGLYKYAITFVTANGETTAGTEREVTTTGGNERVQLSAIPTGPAGTTARKVYRTLVDASQKKLVDTIADNVTTDYLDQIPDGSLGANVPTLNTSGSPDTWQTANITIGTLAVGDFAPCWMRYSFASGLTEVGNARRAEVQFEET